MLQFELPSLLEENRCLHKRLTKGVGIEYEAEDALLVAGKVQLIDLEHMTTGWR